MLKLFNDLVKRKESFKVKDNTVKFYSCGPTIYDYAHIGNFRTFSYEDLLVRFLRFKGYKVIHVRNLTDVEDKIIKRVNEIKKPLKELTDYFANAFFDDCNILGFTNSDFYPRPTELIDDIVIFIQKLMEKGYAYRADDDSVYFSIKKFENYGKLSGIKLQDLKKNGSNRTQKDEYDKESVQDFVLWKAYTKKDGKVFWETELGKGRPGWHIECSVMANKYLGDTLDIHSGGEDLAFPHHENEIAQSEALSNSEFARFWMHSRYLLVDSKKMSKSLGNFYTLRDLTSKGYNPLAVKLLFYLSHYRSPLNFMIENLEIAQKTLLDINSTIEKLTNYYSLVEENEEYKNELNEKSSDFLKKFAKVLDDDLNTSGALAVFFEFEKYVNTQISNSLISNSDINSLLNYFKKYNSIFSLFNFPEKVSKEIMQKAIKRFEERKNKNFEEADVLREEIKKNGYKVDDFPKGFTLTKIN
jgi:cysteinyl-tRNA synthetase